ncbi:MAG: hypothetical protein H0V47_15665 [Chloroflexia bacterium]|nr:hypothetical protein [Chloroflexia bacterium]
MDDDDSRYEAQRLALSRAVAITGITATLAFPLGFYADSAAPDVTNVPFISSDGRGYYLAALLVTIAIGAIVHLLETDDPNVHQRDPDWRLYRPGGPVESYRPSQPATAWMLPVVVLFTSFLFLAIHHPLAYVLLVPLVAAGAVFAARVARYHVLNIFNGPTALARTGHVLLTHGVAFAMLCIVYMFKARTLYSGSVVFIACFLLLMQLTDGIEARPASRMLYAAAGALGLAQLTWALNYWNTSAWFGGSFLMTAFFFTASIVRGQLSGRLTQRLVVERASIAVPFFIALAYFAE